jgi:choline dehydrogenase-like flavoprotein
LSARTVTIVGSGPSGVHIALSLLRKGYAVTMLDVGFSKPPIVNPQDNLNSLKRNLADPVAYFLGEDFQGVVLPTFEKEFYGIPPSKSYIFKSPPGFEWRARGFAPLFSFAAGGIAETWTGGSYPFNDAELADFPFRWKEIGPCYEEVARRIGIIGVEDDLARFHPFHAGLLPPMDLDLHSARLMQEYEKRKSALNRKLKTYLGRTRIAVLSRDLGARKACDKKGRCLWGCPTDAFWTPSLMLKDCLAEQNFRYASGVRVSHFRCDANNRITSVVAAPAGGGAEQEFPVETLVLAAGALSSSKIYLDSIYRDTGKVAQLPGLMDNRQILMPFVNLRLIGASFEPESYQYHQLGMGIEGPLPKEYIHGQITTLKTALLHPVIANLPCDMRLAQFLVRNLHCALGIVNVNLHDTRRETNYLTLATEPGSQQTKLMLHYEPSKIEVHHLRWAIDRMRMAMLRLGCIVPPRMLHVRPMGASVHYAGTLPMSSASATGGHSTDANCRSHRYANLYFADGATFPFLPAKNITFTLMANAVRIASSAF